jgi:predicted phage terminase large subunit-like protein
MRHPSDVPGDGRAEGAGEVGTDAGAGGGRDVAAGHGTSLLDWSLAALGPLGYAPARHHRLLIAELDRVATGDTDRLMLLMPPGSAKSTYASELFPAWFLAHHRRASIIAASHTASLALHFGRRVRTLALDHADLLGYRLDRTHRAAGSWSTDAGGEYYATGIRGPITGRRADLIVIDDPVKGRLEADSALARDQLWDWYRTDLATRLKPTGRIVLVMTRWHQDDLGGRLLGGVADETRGAGVPGDQRPGGRISGEDHWRVVRLPALAEADDPMGRREGEALWPEWEDADRLARKRATVGPRTWSALYQQLPAPDGGALFRVARVALLPAAPAEARYARAWDLAATAASHGRDPDWTVGLKLGREPSGRYVVADIMRLRGGPHEVEQAIVNTAAQDGRAVAIGLPQDPGQAGKQQVAWLAARLAGYRVVASPETGAKTTRAAPVSAQMDAGNFALVSAGWNRDFLDELRDFPQGRKDDQVDALSRAFALLADAPEPARRLNLPFLGR